MNATSNLPYQSLFRKGKGPGQDELEALLSLFPDPALLIDRSKKTIVSINGALSKLTAFSPKDLIGQSQDCLLPELASEPLEIGTSRIVNIRRNKRSPLAVQMQVEQLDNGGRWVFINFIPSHRLSQATTQIKILKGLNALGHFYDEEDAGRYLEKAVETIQGMTDASQVCIYHNFPDLVKLACWEDPYVFPSSITTMDLARLSAFSLWNPGIRVQNSVHVAARAANLSYAASVPLGASGAATGLLVVGDSERQPVENLAGLMNAAGAIISSALQHFILAESQHNQLIQLDRQSRLDKVTFENAHEGILILTRDFQIIDMNPTAELMFEYNRNEVRGQPVEKVLIGSDQLIPALEVASVGKATHNIGDSYLNKRFGKSFPAQIQILPVLENDEVQAIVVHVVDASEHEEFRARTQQLEQQSILGQFSSIIAHEVRNPINNIVLNLQAIGQFLPEDNPNQGFIQDSIKDCRRLADLIQSILSYSKLDLHFKSVDIRELMNYLVNKWRGRMAAANITPTITVDPKTPRVWGDSRSLEQAFTNLISNAIEAMSATGGGTLAINVAPNNSIKDKPQVEVNVSDSGPGVPKEIKEHLFEPFVSANKRGGTGLGLAITKQIITAQQGSIELNSYPGVTIFSVKLAVEKNDKSSDGEI